MQKIVTIGGGTGSFTVLRGIREYPFDISAICTTFDSGGSSGILRDEYGILPPGDIRRCLVALSDDTIEPVLRELFNFRFDNEGSLKGHSFGNLLLTALTQITGSYPEAIEKASQILRCRGSIFPVSLDSSHLCAELEDGTVIKGESNIDIPKHDANLKITKVFLDPPVNSYSEANNAILEADFIIIGPGDLYTSIVPNLLADGISESIQKSKAKTIYISNLMTKLGETGGFNASDFVKEVLKYTGLDKINYLICNTGEITEDQLNKYSSEDKHPVILDDNAIKMVEHVITDNIVNRSDILRHDSTKIGQLINKIAKN